MFMEWSSEMVSLGQRWPAWGYGRHEVLDRVTVQAGGRLVLFLSCCFFFAFFFCRIWLISLVVSGHLFVVAKAVNVRLIMS